MKKLYFGLGLALMLIFSCTSCNESYAKTPETTENTSTTTIYTNTSIVTTTKETLENQISEEEAIQITRNNIDYDVEGGIFEVTNKYTDEDSDVTYFIVHVYSISPTMLGRDNNNNPGEYQQTFTYGWFYVETQTGKIYVEDTYRDEDGNLKLHLVPYR